jgi:hypothetical protein
MHRVSAWAHAVLKNVPRGDFDDVYQEFLRVIIEDRPDRRFVAAKGIKRAYLRRILLYTAWGIGRRKQAAKAAESAVARDECVCGDAGDSAEQVESTELVRQWVAELSMTDQLILSEAFWLTPCTCTSPLAHRSRLCRALKRMRELAAVKVEAPQIGRDGSRHRRFRHKRRVRRRF